MDGRDPQGLVLLEQKATCWRGLASKVVEWLASKMEIAVAGW